MFNTSHQITEFWGVGLPYFGGLTSRERREKREPLRAKLKEAGFDESYRYPYPRGDETRNGWAKEQAEKKAREITSMTGVGVKVFRGNYL